MHILSVALRFLPMALAKGYVEQLAQHLDIAGMIFAKARDNNCLRFQKKCLGFIVLLGICARYRKLCTGHYQCRVFFALARLCNQRLRLGNGLCMF